jgi:hypothetical protein
MLQEVVLKVTTVILAGLNLFVCQTSVKIYALYVIIKAFKILKY